MNADLLFDKAAAHYTHGEHEAAAAIFEQLISLKHAPSATYYAQMFQRGEGVTNDIRRSVELLKMGIDWGDPNAAYNLAAMYWSGGFGLSRDRKTAQGYFRTAKNMGCTLDVDSFIEDNLG